MQNSWSPAELAYLAGIIDGEGCISLMAVRGTTRYGSVLFIGNTDARLVHWIHERFGGKIGLRKRQNQRHKALWFVNFNGATLEPVLSAALPYLVLKREQAALMLEFRATVSALGANQTAPIPTIVITRRAELKARMASLNRRGIRS